MGCHCENGVKGKKEEGTAGKRDYRKYMWCVCVYVWIYICTHACTRIYVGMCILAVKVFSRADIKYSPRRTFSEEYRSTVKVYSRQLAPIPT